VVEIINSWVKKATNNLIDSMISRSDITPDTDLVLANAVYFKGSWLDPFNYCYTSPGKFYRLDGSHVEPSFMWKLTTMYISCMDGFKVLKLPYGPEREYQPVEGTPYKIRRGPRATSVKSGNATQFSMFVFLPDKPDGISTMVDLITSAPGYLYSVLPTETKLVNLKLPKMEISFDWNLGKDLRRLGLTLPFSAEVGDLRGMYKNDNGRPTFLTKVAHKAVIKVNEEGTEAAAVLPSLRGGGGPVPDMVFVADHPFTFMIMEERSGVIVFAGHILDPTRK
jgi:serpin B